MFLLGFISALLVVAAVVGGLYVARSTGASGFASAVDSCHARGLHARLASDETSLTLEAFSDSGDSLTTPIFQCVLGKLGTPAAVRERMYASAPADDVVALGEGHHLRFVPPHCLVSLVK